MPPRPASLVWCLSISARDRYLPAPGARRPAPDAVERVPMSVEQFFSATDLTAVRAHADALDHIELPCAVVHPASFPALAAALGLTTEQLAAVVRCERALIDGEIVDEQTAYERGLDVDFGAHTGADALADRAPEWLIRHVPAEPSRAAAAGGAWLEPPIDAVDVAYIDLAAAASRLRRLVELNAPEILCRMAKHNLQAVFESLVELRAGGADRIVWQPFQELMTGTRCPPRLALRQLGHEHIEVMIEPWLDVMMDEQRTDQLLRRLLAMIGRIVIAPLGKQLGGLRILGGEVQHRLHSCLLPGRPVVTHVLAHPLAVTRSARKSASRDDKLRAVGYPPRLSLPRNQRACTARDRPGCRVRR